MTVGHYNEERSAEWEAVQRWENEGGKLRQQHDYRFGFIGEGYQRHLDQAVTMIYPAARGFVLKSIAPDSLFRA